MVGESDVPGGGRNRIGTSLLHTSPVTSRNANVKRDGQECLSHTGGDDRAPIDDLIRGFLVCNRKEALRVPEPELLKFPGLSACLLPSIKLADIPTLCVRSGRILAEPPRTRVHLRSLNWQNSQLRSCWSFCSAVFSEQRWCVWLLASAWMRKNWIPA